MKNLLLLLLICCGSYVSAQKIAPVALDDKKMDADLSNRKPATLIVQIKNLPDSVKKVSIKYTVVQLAGGFQATKYAETGAGASSRIILDQNLPYQQVWLSVGDYLYAGIYVNTGMIVTIDVQQLPKDGIFMIGDGVTYSGDDGELNTVMNKNVLFRKEEKEDLINNLRALGNLRKKYTSDAFIAKTDSILTLLKNIDKAFIVGFPLYGQAIRNETLSDFYGIICGAYYNDPMPTGVINAINAHHPVFTSNSGVTYYKCLFYYLLSTNRLKKDEVLTGSLKLFDSLYTQQRSDVLKLSLLDLEKDSYSRTYPIIINSIQTNWCKKIAANELIKIDAGQKRIDSHYALSTKLDKADIGISLVRLPFGASLYRLDTAANIDDFISSLKSEFPNKALIIDFWATWCGPCLADLPFSKSLHEQNKDLPIEYIYLCTTSGSTINIWKNRIADLQIPGTHIYVQDKIVARLKTALNSEGGFPTYVVIDKSGKVNHVILQMQTLNRDSLKKIAGL